MCVQARNAPVRSEERTVLLFAFLRIIAKVELNSFDGFEEISEFCATKSIATNAFDCNHIVRSFVREICQSIFTCATEGQILFICFRISTVTVKITSF